MPKMTKGDVQEALVALYLRLNGYFTTGFIVHSATQARVTTELDLLAVRFPNNAEPARMIGCAAELDCWNDGVDFIIAEVKSRGEALQFNQAARGADSVATLLQWWGHLTPVEVATTAADVIAIMQPLPGATSAPTVLCPRAARVRTILFSPERQNRRPEQAWFIPGPPIFEFIWRCLHPDHVRDTCATNYGAGQWGVGLAPLVTYFKDPSRTSPGRLDDLLAHLQVH